MKVLFGILLVFTTLLTNAYAECRFVPSPDNGDGMGQPTPEGVVLNSNGSIFHSIYQYYDPNQLHCSYARYITPGSPNHLLQKVCARSNLHLPTVRELARSSQVYGAKGILEISSLQGKKPPLGYQLIKAINPDGTEDQFYFSASGYKNPYSGQAGAPPRYFSGMQFWSNSIGDYKWAIYYQLNASSGKIELGYDGFTTATLGVRCFPDN